MLLYLVLELLNLLTKSSQFIVVETSVLSFQLCLVVRLFLLLGQLVESLAHLGIGREVGYFFQNFYLLLLVALQELSELALCQHCGTAELTELQSYRLLNGFAHLIYLLSAAGICFSRGEVLERPGGWVEADVGLFLLASLHMPFGFV